MGGSSLASTRRAALQPHPGWGVGPPASHGEPNPLIHTILDKKCANCRGKSLFGGSESHGEALQSTAKRGWMKQCPRRIVRETEGAPMRRGPLGKTRQAPMRQGPLDITAILFGDVRAGRAAARSDVPERFRTQVRPEACRLLKNSSCCPGLTASIPAARGVEAASRDLPLRFFLAPSRYLPARSARRGRSLPGGKPGGGPGAPGTYSTADWRPRGCG
jgi:hypothetical protein